MALEQPPPKLENLSLESLKIYRPSDGDVYTWHTVSNGMQENFSTISAKYQVPVNHIIDFNFPGSVKANRLIPEVVNWYLHYHIGFSCPETHDKKNRIFKGGEQIAIPYHGILRWDTPKITYLNQEEDILHKEKYNIFLPVKFVGGWESKKAYTAGYFLFGLKFDYEGELIRKDCRHKITVSRKEFKYGVEKKFENDLSFGIASKVKEGFQIQDLGGLLKSKTSTSFANKMAEIFIIPVEFSLKQTFKLNKKVNLTPEFRVDLAKRDSGPDKGGTGLPMPAILRLQLGYSDIIHFGFDEEKKYYKYFYEYKLAGTFSVSIGLSLKGWEMAYKIGRQAVTRLAAALGSEAALSGIIVFASSIALGFACAYFLAWYTADARRNGRTKGLESLYVTAYVHKVFGRERDFISNGDPLRDKKTLTVESGEKDAIADARELLRKNKHPQANGTDKQVLNAYMWVLIDLNGGDYSKNYNAAYSQLRELVTKSLIAHL